tara:strand:+ start:159 stop:545 length:387 start_codon:yes stop_codon:yes gene_type:complete
MVRIWNATSPKCIDKKKEPLRQSPSSGLRYFSLAEARDLGFGLLGYAAFLLDGDVGHGSGVGCAVKVVLTGGNDNYITFDDNHGLVVGANTAGTIGDDQYLVARMLVELGPRTGIKVSDTEAKIAAVI